MFFWPLVSKCYVETIILFVDLDNSITSAWYGLKLFDTNCNLTPSILVFGDKIYF